MNVFLVLAHPENRSFNAAMFEQARTTLVQAGHQVRTSDLYRMRFNPVSGPHNFLKRENPDFYKQQLEELHATRTGSFAPELEAELEKLEWCDLMIWQFPLWWFGVPAVLKGWADRVLAMGRIYGDGFLYENGRLRGKRALLSLTTGGGQADYRDGGLNGELAGMLRPIHRGIFEFTGMDVLEPQVVYGPVRIGEVGRQAALQQWHERLLGLETEASIQVGSY